MRRSVPFRLFALFLCTILCLHQLDAAAYSEPEETPAFEEPSDPVIPEPEAPLVPSVSGNTGDPAEKLPFNRTPLEADDKTIVDELTERREEGTKHFLLSDGSRTAVVYGFPVHEKDAAGEWTEIDK